MIEASTAANWGLGVLLVFAGLSLFLWTANCAWRGYPTAAPDDRVKPEGGC